MFVDGNILMDIDAPTVLVILLPLDALSYEEAIIFVPRNQPENLSEVVP